MEMANIVTSSLVAETISNIKIHINKDITLIIKSSNALLKLLCKLLHYMKPATETKLGLTFGQAYAILTLLIMLGGGWLSLTSRITALEEGRKINAENIYLLRGENAKDHDKIILDLKANNVELKENNKILNTIVGQLSVKK